MVSTQTTGLMDSILSIALWCTEVKLQGVSSAKDMYLMLYFNNDHIYINTIIPFRRFPKIVATGQEGQMSHCIRDLSSLKKSAPLSLSGLSACQESERFLKYSGSSY